MATISTTGQYPEDLLGTNPKNLITAEVQTLQVPGKDDFYFIIPHAAPFFVDSLEVYNAQTGAKYKENDDYLVGHWFIEAMDSIGRPIAGSIRFMKRGIVGQVRLRYRTIGGNWGFSETQILAELSRRLLNPLKRSWGQIGELPYSFPPLAHDESLDSLVGSKEITDALKHLADVIEATTTGASDAHLKDFNNPHKVNKAQVLLGNVQNYGMADSAAAIAGLRSDLYISPATMLAAITAQALNPLNAHINAKGNVHGLTAADINLGRVPNYPAATPTTALDITNDAALLTPYTGALLIQKLMNTARVDELEDKLNKHILDRTTNPHNVTAEQVGTYTKARIDQLIAAGGGGGGNADTFGGKTPAEWAAGFISVQEFDTFIGSTQFGGAVTAAKNSASDPANTPEPYTPAELTEYELSKIDSARAGYDAYVVNTQAWRGRAVVATGIPLTGSTAPFPELMPESLNQWYVIQNARYGLTPRGGIKSQGSAAINAPVGYKDDAAFVVANASDGIWASKTELFSKIKATGSVRKFKSDNTNVEVFKGVAWTASVPGREAVGMSVAPQLTYPESLAVVEVEVTTGANKTVTTEWVPLGDATFVSTMTTVMNTVKATAPITEIHINETHVLFIVKDKGAFIAAINRTNPAAVSVSLMNNPNVFNGATGQSTPIRSAALISANGHIRTGVGNYGHFALLTNDEFIWFFGDNSDGQCDVKVNQQKIRGVAAGYKFTVTVNDVHQPQFFGDSPDNALLYAQRGIRIPLTL